jgi:hypothetical protein
MFTKGILTNNFSLKSPTKPLSNKPEKENVKEPIKELPQEGLIEHDKPVRIKNAKQNKERDKELICEIEWAQRENGQKPKNSFYTNEELKKQYPMLLCNFYESRLKFPTIKK